MSEDDLRTVVRDGVVRLHKYIKLLESLLASAKAAEELFPSVVSSVGGLVPNDREAPSLGSSAFGSDPRVAQKRPVLNSEFSEDHRRLESALIAEGPSGHNRVLKALRVIAVAGKGELDFGLTYQLLRNLGISKGTPENVSSYVSKRLRVSSEFERVGAPGSGKYRWLPYQEEQLEDFPDSAAGDCGSSDSPKPVETVESPRV